MPGRMPPTSQLDWLNSTTATIVLLWSRATRDLLKACPGEGRGRSAGASRHSDWIQATKLPALAARPIASSSTAAREPIAMAFRPPASDRNLARAGRFQHRGFAACSTSIGPRTCWWQYAMIAGRRSKDAALCSAIWGSEARGPAFAKTEFATDSPLEEDGFQLP